MASYFTSEYTLSQILDKGKNVTAVLVDQSKKVRNTVKCAADAVGTRWEETSTLTKVCVIGGTAAVTAPLAIIPFLGAVGFTSAGVAAGSIAASMQTATTISGSVFALCQSAGAVGAVAASTSVGVGLAAGTAAGGITAVVCSKKDGDQNNQEKQGETEEAKDAQDSNDGSSHSLEEQLTKSCV